MSRYILTDMRSCRNGDGNWINNWAGTGVGAGIEVRTKARIGTET